LPISPESREQARAGKSGGKPPHSKAGCADRETQTTPLEGLNRRRRGPARILAVAALITSEEQL